MRLKGMETQQRRQQGRAFTPNARDRKILAVVLDYRYLSAMLITALLAELPRDGKRYGFGLAGVRARCQILRDHGYLTAHFLRDRPTGRGYRDERGPVYSIGVGAIKFLVEQNRADKAWLQSIIARSNVTGFFLRHFLGIARFRVCLELACRATHGRIRIGTWLQEGLNDAVNVRIDDKMQRIPVVPDAVFALIVTDATGTVLKHFALEYDRGTMPLVDIRRKALGYLTYYREKLFRRRYTYAGSTGLSPELRFVTTTWNNIVPANQQQILDKSIQSFQVLFVTETTAQQSNEKLNGVPVRQTNLMSTVGKLMTEISNNNLFAFCADGIDYDIHRPHRLFEPIWRTPRLKSDAIRLV